MKQLWLLVFTIVPMGCSEIVPGTCYPNPAGGTGDEDPMPIAGVGVSATGDYATEPPKRPLDVGDGVGGGWAAPPRQPQDAPPPDCLSVPQTPCEEKCLSDYKTAAGTCGNIENEAQRNTCRDTAYASYKTCRANCQLATKSCTDMYEACQDKGKPCTREIDPGKTLCAFCLDDCQANRPYKYSECRSCGFE